MGSKCNSAVIAALAMMTALSGAAVADPIVKSPEAAAMDAKPGCDTALVTPLPQALNYYVDARVIGETCETGVFLLILRGDDGVPVYTFSAPTASIFMMEYAASRSDMADALEQVIASDATGPLSRTSGLPEWPEGQETPETSSEFPFLPEDWMDRTYYEDMRNSGLPMYCPVPRKESMACIVLDDDRLENVGVQVFPG